MQGEVRGGLRLDGVDARESRARARLGVCVFATVLVASVYSSLSYADTNERVVNDLNHCATKMSDVPPLEVFSRDNARDDDDQDGAEFLLDRQGDIVRNQHPHSKYRRVLSLFDSVPDYALNKVDGSVVVVEYAVKTRDLRADPQRIGCAVLDVRRHETRVQLRRADPHGDVIRVAVFMTRKDAEMLKLVPRLSAVEDNEEQADYKQLIDEVWGPLGKVVDAPPPKDDTQSAVDAGTSPTHDVPINAGQAIGQALVALARIDELDDRTDKAIDDWNEAWMRRKETPHTDCTDGYAVHDANDQRAVLDKALTDAMNDLSKAPGFSGRPDLLKLLAPARTAALAMADKNIEEIGRYCAPILRGRPPDVQRIDDPIESRVLDRLLARPDVIKLNSAAKTLSDKGDLSAFKTVWDEFAARHSDKNAVQTSLKVIDVENIVVDRVQHNAARTSWTTRDLLHPHSRELVDWMLFGTFDLPETNVDHTLSLHMSAAGTGQQPVAQLHGSALVTAWATHVSTRTPKDFSIFWIEGPDASNDASAVLGAYFSGLGSRFTVSSANLGVTNNVDIYESDQLQRLPEPLAQYTSVARTSDAIPGKRHGMLVDRGYNVLACLGCAEDSGADDKTDDDSSDSDTKVTSSASFDGKKASSDSSVTIPKDKTKTPATPVGSVPVGSASGRVVSPGGWGLTIMLGMTYDLQMQSNHSAIFSEYAWRQSATSATQTAYRLDSTRHGAEGLSFAGLLMVLTPEHEGGRVAFGGGVNFLDGTGTASSFREFTFNVAWSPPVRYLVNRLYFTMGGGVRIVQDLQKGSSVGDTIVLAATSTGPPSAPKVATRDATVAVCTMGIAVNLSILTDAISSWVKGSK